MASPGSYGVKFCVICKKDCSKRPRTKDKEGRYYCRECIEQIKQEHQARASDVAKQRSSVRPESDQFESDEAFELPPEGMIETIAASPLEHGDYAEVVAAPSRSAGDLAGALRQRFAGVAAFLGQPWVAFIVPVVVFAVLYFAAHQSGDAAAIFVVMSLLFSAVIWLIVRIVAFLHGIGTGLLTLCVPFYEIYFVLAVNENGHIKALYAAAILAMMASYTLDINSVPTM